MTDVRTIPTNKPTLATQLAASVIEIVLTGEGSLKFPLEQTVTAEEVVELLGWVLEIAGLPVDLEPQPPAGGAAQPELPFGDNVIPFPPRN
jgi:hypothetical protein